jgi:hypothetical protein
MNLRDNKFHFRNFSLAILLSSSILTPGIYHFSIVSDFMKKVEMNRDSVLRSNDAKLIFHNIIKTLGVASHRLDLAILNNPPIINDKTTL